MGKRLRRLHIAYGKHDITITSHAVRRYRERVDAVTHDEAVRQVRLMIGKSYELYSLRSDSRKYLGNEKCVFVLTSTGVIITVLSAFRQHSYLFRSKKEAARKRREKNRQVRRVPYKNSRKPRRPPQDDHHSD